MRIEIKKGTKGGLYSAQGAGVKCTRCEELQMERFLQQSLAER